ncbi:hypothetical protein [Nubsella zeaxanthinifaciens]|uniref:hypothetical protein n=1 Tax=Nubsella zeaxanthinifaciens TaxID=392412 RepID=UPI000DE535EB|nr:hypothetical protein [Nubsella zeaxanthinifaciens]
MTHILIVCANQPIAQTIARLIEKIDNWKAAIALSLLEAQQQCEIEVFDIALIGAGITDDEEQELRLSLTKQKAKTKVVKHYGGGSGLLYAEIYQALAKK